VLDCRIAGFLREWKGGKLWLEDPAASANLTGTAGQVLQKQAWQLEATKTWHNWVERRTLPGKSGL
jgi:hypothetical protein